MEMSILCRISPVSKNNAKFVSFHPLCRLNPLLLICNQTSMMKFPYFLFASSSACNFNLTVLSIQMLHSLLPDSTYKGVGTGKYLSEFEFLFIFLFSVSVISKGMLSPTCTQGRVLSHMKYLLLGWLRWRNHFLHLERYGAPLQAFKVAFRTICDFSFVNHISLYQICVSSTYISLAWCNVPYTNG